MAPARRQALTPDALQMMDAIARNGSFAAAARELGRVPSALTYSVRQLEEALDVLLFDRRSRQAQLTPAGEELLAEGRRLLQAMDAVANRVHRVATGWESELTIAVDTLISSAVVFDLVAAFFEQQGQDGEAPGTRLRLKHEVMTGTWEALVLGQADLAIGTGQGSGMEHADIASAPLGEVPFIFVLSPRHPLAGEDGPLADADLAQHRAIAIADSAQRLSPATFNLLPGQDVLTVPTMAAKLEALARGLGCGFMPQCLVQAWLDDGRLLSRAVQRTPVGATMGYAWRRNTELQPGRALQWWLNQLASPTTRRALVHGSAHGGAA